MGASPRRRCGRRMAPLSLPLVFTVVLVHCCCCCCLGKAAAPLDAYSWQLNSSFLDDEYDTGVLVQTLQGLANRAASEGVGRPLLLDSFELFNQYYGSDRYWAAYLSAKKGMRFTNLTASGKGDLDSLLTASALPGVVNGTVLYSGSAPEPDGTRYVALTLCALEGLLPVTPKLRAIHPALGKMPVAHDLRNRFATNQAAYEWSIANLMPRVDQSVGWSAGRSHRLDDGHFVWQGSPPEMPLLGLDVAVSKRGFIFNLSPNATRCEHPARPMVDCRGSPEEAALFDRVMANLNGTASADSGVGVPETRPLPAIYGWSEAESEYTIRISKGGGYVLWCAARTTMCIYDPHAYSCCWLD